MKPPRRRATDLTGSDARDLAAVKDATAVSSHLRLPVASPSRSGVLVASP
jgi:hypothetical protein